MTTPYQQFVNQELANTAHTAHVTKRAWNAALDYFSNYLLAHPLLTVEEAVEDCKEA